MLHGCEDAVAGRGARVSIGFFFFLLREGRILVVSLKCNYITSPCMQSHTPTLIEPPPLPHPCE